MPKRASATSRRAFDAANGVPPRSIHRGRFSVPAWILVCCLGGACGSEDHPRTRKPDSGAPTPDSGAINEHDAAVPEDEADAGGGPGTPITCGPKDGQLVFVYRGATDLNGYGLSWPALNADFEGTVQELGSGIPSGLTPFSSEKAPGAAYLRVAAPTGESWTVVARNLDTFGVQLQATVRFVVQLASGAFYQPLSLRVRMYEKAALRFAYVHNADPPEGFSVEPGAKLCRESNRCGRWTSHKLRVGGPCAETAEIEPFGRGRVCDHDVLAGRHVLERHGERKCDDWFVRGMEMILIPARGPDTDAGI